MKARQAVRRRGARSAVSLAVIAAVAMAIAASASATPGTAVTISNTVSFDENPEPDPFTSSGGIVCASGTSTHLFAVPPLVVAGGQSGFRAQILVGKHFVCEDGSGTFDLLLRVTLDFGTEDTYGTWSVVRGTGDYDKLHGGGKIAGDRLPDGGIQDEFTGTVHID